MAVLAKNVSAERVRAAPAALKTPPPSPVAPAPPLPPAPPMPDVPTPLIFPPKPPLPPLPPFPANAWLVEMKHVFSVSEPAALKIAPPSPTVPALPAPPAPPVCEPAAPFAPVAPFLPTATLSKSCTDVSVTAPPEFRIPPPSPTARPCSITTFEIATLPPRISKTRSRLLPLMIVWPLVLPLIVTFAEMLRSPLELPSPPVGGMVSVNVPAGSTIVSDLGLASAAMIADRSEMFPEASFPLLRFTATVSENVLTLNVESTTRSSSPSSLGLSRRTRALSFRLRKLNMLHPFRKMSATPRTQPEIRALSDPRLRSDLPIKIGALSGTSGECASILACLPASASCEATPPFSVPCSLQLPNQVAEVGAIAHRVEFLALCQPILIVEPGGEGLVKPRHRLVRLFLGPFGRIRCALALLEHGGRHCAITSSVVETDRVSSSHFLPEFRGAYAAIGVADLGKVVEPSVGQAGEIGCGDRLPLAPDTRRRSAGPHFRA